MAIDKAALAKKAAENTKKHHEATMAQPDDAINVDLRPQPGEEVHQIPLSQLVPSRYQVKNPPDPVYLDSLAESIMECGLVTPVVVRKVKVSNLDTLEGGAAEVGAFELVAGHTRVSAVAKLGWGSISAVIRVMTDAEAAKSLTTDNAVRKNLSDYELFRHLEMLEAERAVKTVSGLAEILGCNRQHIYRLRSYAALPADAVPLLRANKDLVGATLAEELAKDGCCESHPSVVVNAISLLNTGAIKRQGDVLAWIKKRISPLSRRVTPAKEIKLDRPGRAPVKILLSVGETRIRGEGLNQEKLQKLIEDHLDELY